MTRAEGLLVVSIAQSQLGVVEDTGNNDGLPSVRYMRAKRTVPWCAYFVLWCYERAGLTIPGNWWKLGAVSYLEHQLRLCGQVVDRDQLDQVQPGAIILFANRGDSDTGPGRHCGIVVQAGLGQVETIEGNVLHGVRRRLYAADSSRVSGYGWI